MMESGHFYLVITDIDGKILKFNRNFEKISADPFDYQFSNFLSPNSESEFTYSLELMLGAPKIRRHLLLEHPTMINEGFSQIWWEFSVITTPDMDISGIIGIGVGMQFLEQEMPWNNLVDVLGFGKIILDRDFKVRSWDERIAQWFEPDLEKWNKKNLLDTPSFKGNSQLSFVLETFSYEIKPRCFLIQTNEPESISFAALLIGCQEGYNLFLVPKDLPSSSQLDKKLIPEPVLDTLPGSVFVLSNSGKLLQQNASAKELARIWKGRAYSEGYTLNFPNQPNRFSKLLRAIEEGKKGQSSDLELKLLMPNQEFAFWNASVRPIPLNSEFPEGIVIQVWDSTPLKSQIVQLNRENERLRDLALSPSHILRGPLSSMMGLLELIDAKQMDQENQKLFGYLKPLTKELDQIIRQHAKKMSAFN
ncbi:nitrogen regulation protein NR(II) [Algoriphagus lacus]|nr:hypothetical protein [Algoriphagus lacus]